MTEFNNRTVTDFNWEKFVPGLERIGRINLEIVMMHSTPKPNQWWFDSFSTGGTGLSPKWATIPFVPICSLKTHKEAERPSDHSAHEVGTTM